MFGNRFEFGFSGDVFRPQHMTVRMHCRDIVCIDVTYERRHMSHEMRRSVQRPERWKHNFLKRNGTFDFAERQKPQRATPRKMETQFSEAQWYVRLCRTTATGRVQWPERWKRDFLKRCGMFCFAERQKPQRAWSKKMETRGGLSHLRCESLWSRSPKCRSVYLPTWNRFPGLAE